MSSNIKNIVREKPLGMKYVVSVSLFAILVTIGLTVSPAQGKASTETQTETFPVEGTILGGNCPGVEQIEYSGTIKIISHTTSDRTGGFHSKVEFIYNLKGIGLTSGDKYTLKAVGGSESNIISEDGQPMHFSATSMLHITDGTSEKAKSNVQVTINANGELTVDKFTLTIECD